MNVYEERLNHLNFINWNCTHFTHFSKLFTDSPWSQFIWIIIHYDIIIFFVFCSHLNNNAAPLLYSLLYYLKWYDLALIISHVAMAPVLLVYLMCTLFCTFCVHYVLYIALHSHDHGVTLYCIVYNTIQWRVILYDYSMTPLSSFMVLTFHTWHHPPFNLSHLCASCVHSA